MSEYPWNEKNNTLTWLSSLYNHFKGFFEAAILNVFNTLFSSSIYGVEDIVKKTIQSQLFTFTTLLHRPWINPLFSSIPFLVCICVTDACVPVSCKSVNSLFPLASEFFLQIIMYATPQRVMFPALLLLVVAPVIDEIKYWIPDILLIRLSKWCIVLQINSLSLFSVVVHTARHDNAILISH